MEIVSPSQTREKAGTPDKPGTKPSSRHKKPKGKGILSSDDSTQRKYAKKTKKTITPK